MSIRAKTKVEEDHCPECGKADLWYGVKDWHGDQFCQDVACNACDFEFRQWYKIEFAGMTIVDVEHGGNIDID
jgi:hypothetical protein